jgi:hypothetical protein
MFGAFVSVQLAAPYTSITRRLSTNLKAIEKSGQKVPTGIVASLKFLMLSNGRITTGQVALGHPPVLLPFARARYRHRYRQCKRYFRWLDANGPLFDGRLPGPWAMPLASPWYAPQRYWSWRQRRTLRLLARDLMLATSSVAPVESVKAIAIYNQIEIDRPHVRRVMVEDFRWGSAPNETASAAEGS